MAAVAAVRIAHATLAANTADTVTMSGGAGGATAEIVHHGGAVTDPIFFRTDGVAAAKMTAENQMLLPGERLTISLGKTGVVSVISNGAAPYSVIML